MDPETQLEKFRTAVTLLGGQTAAARALDMSERSMRFLVAGERRLHSGIMEDMANALIAHADKCRALERELSPAFAANLTPANAPPLHDGRASARKPKPDPAKVAAIAARLGLTPGTSSAKD